MSVDVVMRLWPMAQAAKNANLDSSPVPKATANAVPSMRLAMRQARVLVICVAQALNRMPSARLVFLVSLALLLMDSIGASVVLLASSLRNQEPLRVTFVIVDMKPMPTARAVCLVLRVSLPRTRATANPARSLSSLRILRHVSVMCVRMGLK